MPLPPDRGTIRTEHRHPCGSLDTRDTRALIAAMVRDQHEAVDAVANAAHAIESFIDALAKRLQRGGRLISLGAGTSGRLAVLDASECPPTFNARPDQIIGLIAGGDRALRVSSESTEDDPDGAHETLDSLDLRTDDTVLGIAAGGTTPWVLGGVKHAAAHGAMTALITCVPLEAGWVDHHILLDTGPELLTGSTRLKAGTATKIALNTITTLAFIRLGKVYDNLMIDLRATNAKLHDRCLRILTSLCPTLDRKAADTMLQLSDGVLPVALVMARLDVDARTARSQLANSDLRSLIG